MVDHVQTQARLERVARLVDGFETAFGLELLSTVHWVMAEGHARDDRAIERETYAWNVRKRLFTPGQIALAAERLRREGWVADADADAHAVA